MMSGKQVQALYDFQAQPGAGELSISPGEILTVTRTDVGEGWWEGTNSRGESGLFPEAYVEEVIEDDGPPPSMAPPPLPPDYGSTATQQPPNNGEDDWGNAGWGITPAAQQQQPPQQQSWTNDYQAYDQDDWDSDFDDTSEQQSSGTATNNLNIPKNSGQSGSSGDISSIGRSDSRKTSAAAAASSARSFNRFSTFVKSGSENYVLGKCSARVQEGDVIQVVESGDGKYNWLNAQPPYSCSVASPKKESKLKGLKSFIAYQLTPSFNNIQVSRRYKHFDWLHERLVEKFSLIPIPPLPDKQIQGRYEEEFIEHRMNQLQSFVDRVCRHPILSQSEVWQHFLTCTDEKRWKTGKRKAEKDALVGGNLFLAINRPEKPLDPDFMDHEVEVFTKFSASFDGAVKNMSKLAADQTQKCQTHFKREFQTIGKSFQQLGDAMGQDGGTYSPNLTNAITITGETYEEISKMYDDQPRNDWEHYGDMMHDYKGMLSMYPGILQIHAGAVSKTKDLERLAREGKINQGEILETRSRTDTLSYSMLAEINTFHQQRVKDMKFAHQNFLKEQIAFYQKIVEKLQDSLRMYDNC